MYTFTKLHHRRIPNVGVGVRVGVGPVEFQLYPVSSTGMGDRLRGRRVAHLCM